MCVCARACVRMCVEEKESARVSEKACEFVFCCLSRTNQDMCCEVYVCLCAYAFMCD
eukprot:m.86178 g.86178  ORF g.86178 m.86178 type:complete len:57 (+) comp25939_c0_seq1:91-261(+)